MGVDEELEHPAKVAMLRKTPYTNGLFAVFKYLLMSLSSMEYQPKTTQIPNHESNENINFGSFGQKCDESQTI